WDGLSAALRLASRQVLVSGIVVGEGRVIDLVEIGQTRLPVVRVSGVRDVLRGAAALRHQERPGADGNRIVFADGVLDLGPDVLRNDWLLAGDVVKGWRRRRLEGHDHLVGSLLADSGEHRPDRLEVEGAVRLDQVERIEDVIRREWLAVAPLDTRPDGEGQRLIIRAPLVGAGLYGRFLAGPTLW